MNRFSDDIITLVNNYNEIIAISQSKAFITIGIEIQNEEIENLNQYINELHEIKKQYAQKQLEDSANLIYCLEKSSEVIKLELQMLTNLKNDKMDAAWENLVNAQILFNIVLKHSPFDKKLLKRYSFRLADYERLLFPKMSFFSIGGIVKESKCSICNTDYNDCEHQKGKLYNGELCTRILVEIDLEEYSSVENPASKHCRLISVEKNGEMIDILTQRTKKNTDKIK